MRANPEHLDAGRSKRAARRHNERYGHRAEALAAILMRLHGYRILARRTRSPLGEIDIVAVRGRRLAFVEVKRRGTLEAAEAALSLAQRERIRRAAMLWLGRNERYRAHEIGFDLILVVPRKWPRYLRNAL